MAGNAHTVIFDASKCDRIDRHRRPHYDLALPLLPDMPEPTLDCLHEGVAEPNALQYVDAGGCLEARYAADWEALDSLQALTCLQGFKVYCAPPQLWQHCGLRKLDLNLEGLSGQDTAQVLVAFPSLQHAEVAVSAQAGPGSSVMSSSCMGYLASQGVSQQLSSLAYLRLSYRDDGSGVGPAVRVAPLLAAVCGVQQLDLGWWCSSSSGSGQRLAQVPALSCLTAVTQLQLRGGGFDQEDLYGMLQPLAPTLKVLKLESLQHISPRVALVLQYMLPHLKCVHFQRCRSMSEEQDSGWSDSEQLQRMQRLLRPGLTVVV